jgi:protein-disulfide isomerase
MEENNLDLNKHNSTENEISRTTPDPNRTLFLLLPVAVLVGVLIGYAIWGNGSTSPATAEAPAQAPSAATPAPGEMQRFPVDADDDPTLGPDNAPIQLIEFGDYNCGYCRKFHVETFPVLMDLYSGQIQYVYRDFPILGQTSLDASIAANCAGYQGKYWEYHGLLYSGRMTLGADAFNQYAAELNLDAGQFTECLNSEEPVNEIVADAELVASFGARGTPVFFINGIPLVGAAPVEQFMAIIDSELGAQ